MKKKCTLLPVMAVLLLLSACAGGGGDAGRAAASDPGGSVEPAEKRLEEPAPEPAGLYPGKLLYDGSPICQFLGASRDRVTAAFGDPLSEDEWGNISYDGLLFLCDYNTGEVSWIQLSPGKCEIDGTALNQKRAGLTSLLGDPVSEDWSWTDDGYYMEFGTSCYMIRFDMEDPEAEAESLLVGFDLAQPVSADYISLSIPSTWGFQYEEGGGYIYFEVDCGDDNIAMSVFESRDSVDDLRSYTFDGPFSLEKLTFADGAEGYCARDGAKALFSYGEGEAHCLVDYGGDPAWYEENEPLVRAVVKTLAYEPEPYVDAGGGAGGGSLSGEILTGDGKTLSSGDTVYRSYTLNTILQGRVTSIDSADSVNVVWEKALVMNLLGGVSEESTVTYNMWGSASFVMNGATMPVGDKTNYRASQLYRSANNAW